MYNDGGVTDNLWTGQEVGGEWVYPSAPQNLVVTFTPPSPEQPFYLSAADGDFTSSGATITSEVGQSDDITMGNATAAVFSATLLNPDGLMESLSWGEGAVFIGVETSSVTSTILSPVEAYVLRNGHAYLIDSTTMKAPNDTETYSGTAMAVVVNNDGTAWYYTSTKAYYYDGSTITESTPDPFLANKYRKENTDRVVGLDDPSSATGILLDSDGLPSKITFCYNNGTKLLTKTYKYIPMGVFDFSNVDAYGITFSVEAYDRMVKFDADATDWLNNVAWPETYGFLMTDIVFRQLGLSGFYWSSDAVNTSEQWSSNPVPNYAVTYRQVLRWLTELVGCNLSIYRDGNPKISIYNGLNSVATITPDTVISNTRSKARYEVPQITEVFCYDLFGMAYSVGTSGSTLYIVANPFFDPAASTTPMSNLLTLYSGHILQYYPTTISVACADPRIDTGDYITVEATDGTSYMIPIMRQTLTWNGTCKATYTATGNQVRQIPAGLETTDLAGTVNSNTQGLIDRIEAIGITANKLIADDGINETNIEENLVQLSDGTTTLTITAGGPTPTSGYNQVNSMASGTAYHTITSFTLDPGTYIVQVHFAFATNTSGRRVGIVSYSQDSASQIATMWRASAAPVNGENTFLNICGVVKPNSTTTFYLNAMQNSGSGLNTFASYSYVRLA